MTGCTLCKSDALCLCCHYHMPTCRLNPYCTASLLLQIIYIDAKHFRLNTDSNDRYWGIGDADERLKYGGPKERDSVARNNYNVVSAV